MKSDNLPAHAVLAPSSSARWLVCPGSKHCPPSLSNAAAEAGTAGHAAAEKWLPEYGPVAALLMEEEVFAAAAPLVGRHTAGEIAEAASFYTDTVSREPGERLLEQKLKHPEIADFFGTLDCLILRDDELHIFDLKTGRWPAHLEQMSCYALLAHRNHPRPIVYATVLQRRAQAAVQRRSWSPGDLDAFEDRVRKAASSDEIVPGEHCRFCTLRPQCKPGQRYAKTKGWPIDTAHRSQLK